jgi:Protein of unknown function (DUF3311)
MKRLLLALTVVAVYALHQDFWFWRVSEPLVFGLFPIGLFYHLGYTLAIALLMWLLVRYAWPTHLAAEVESQPVEPIEEGAAP